MNVRSGRTMCSLAWVCALLVACARAEAVADARRPSRRRRADEEERLVRVLLVRPPSEKVEACKRLKIVGTAGAVPALASLLSDRRVSIFARYALETMSCPEAGAALRGALADADGTIKAGIIDTLGERGELESVAALARLLGDADREVASSAAAALGKIGGRKAVRALQRAFRKIGRSAGGTVRPSVVDALLLCADRLLAGGDGYGASAVYRELYKPGEKDHVRTAAYRGLVLAADDPVELVRSALTGKDEAAEQAALQLVPIVTGRRGGEAATRAFAALIPEVRTRIQAALIESLARRGDAAAAQAVARVLKSPSLAGMGAVRVAALRALGTLGGPATVALLAQAAAESKGVERKTARASLKLIRGPRGPGDIRRAILSEFLRAEPRVLAELARALGARDDRGAVPELLKMVRKTVVTGKRGEVRLAALGALGALADESALADMVGLLARSESDGERRGAEAALASVLARSSKKEECVGSVLAGLAGASGPARCALVRVAGRVGGASMLQVLRKAVHDDDRAVRDAAIRTMAGTCGLGAAPDLLGLAIGAKTLTHRVLALRGYWRLAALATELPLEERWQMCKAAMAACERPQERRLGLPQLATIPRIDALKLAEDLSAEKGIRAEAEVACVSIAGGLKEPYLDAAKNALRRLAAQAQDERTRAEAQRALAAMDQDVDVEYIPTWFVAGPYRQEGKECTALFDIAFPPEKHGSAGMFAWQPAPPPSAPSKSWQADLGEVARGNHCVVYLKARVSVPQAQKVRLDITSDDGVKLWVNGQLVHANNAVRGMKRDEDRAEADLRQGANEVLLKITQHTMGCGAAVRIRNPDGSVVKGLRFW